MINIRRASDRGFFDFGWLQTHHTFSFGDYFDSEHMGFRVLRVINDDVVAPGKGFPTHPHRDMEIITYILEGALQHRDSMGTGSTIRRGDVQRMSAGTGVTHSEFNASATEPVHLYQIWIIPNAKGLAPEYEQKLFKDEDKKNRWRLLVSESGREGSIAIHQDAELYATLLDQNATLECEVPNGRHAWIQVLSGKVACDGEILGPGDGFHVSNLEAESLPVRLEAIDSAECLRFALP